MKIKNKFHELAKEKGWWVDRDPNNPTDQVVVLALIGTEVSEAIQEVRKGNQEGLKEELADIMIRLLDFAGALEIDIFQLVEEKHNINKHRSIKHGRVL
jgi:NTP pyrophosphatase (non-canonical NTP hydrolase)